MHGFDVNWLAVFSAAVIRFVIGGLWFAPFAFGPAWGRMVGIDAAAMKARMGRAMVVDFLAGLVLAWVLANLLQFLGVTRLVAGARAEGPPQGRQRRELRRHIRHRPRAGAADGGHAW